MSLRTNGQKCAAILHRKTCVQGVDKSLRGENQSVFLQLCDVQEEDEEDDE